MQLNLFILGPVCISGYLMQQELHRSVRERRQEHSISSFLMRRESRCHGGKQVRCHPPLKIERRQILLPRVTVHLNFQNYLPLLLHTPITWGCPLKLYEQCHCVFSPHRPLSGYYFCLLCLVDSIMLLKVMLLGHRAGQAIIPVALLLKKKKKVIYCPYHPRIIFVDGNYCETATKVPDLCCWKIHFIKTKILYSSMKADKQSCLAGC